MLSHDLKKAEIQTLISKKKEIYNFQKLSGVLADYGFCTIKLQDDWQGVDFITQNMFDGSFLKVQLKGEAGGVFHKKYAGKDIFIAFPYKGDWYLYPHDKMYAVFSEKYHGIKRLYEEGMYDAFIHTGRNNETSISNDKLALLSGCKL